MRIARLACSTTLTVALLPLFAWAQGSTARVIPDDIKISLVADQLPGFVIRLDYHAERDLFFVMQRNGKIGTFDRHTNTYEEVADGSDLGMSKPQGFAISPEGDLFVSGNDFGEDGVWVTGLVKRSRLVDGTNRPAPWSTVAETVPYQLSKDFNHLMSALTVDPLGQWLYINSGARSDHGEVQDNGGNHPGTREVPLTSAILRLPADGNDIVLHNDMDSLIAGGYLFADGVRNHFDLTFGPNAHLFGAESSGDRDDAEELNWIQEGLHYGFPWRIGTHDTPQQFADYDPSKDPLINPTSVSAQLGLFVNDPSFPDRPPGVDFTDPILNSGPDGVEYRDPNTGEFLDAAETGRPVGSFTPHKTPLGLVFDTAGVLAEPYTGGGFVLGWNQDTDLLLGPFGDPGEDLLHLDLKFDGEDLAGYSMTSTRIANSFMMPVDAVLLDTAMYVMEMRFGGTGARMYRIDFPRRREVAEPTREIPTALVPDVTVRHISEVPSDVVRVDYSAADDALYYMTRGGDVWTFNLATEQATVVADRTDHGISEARGMAVTGDGRMFVMGWVHSGKNNVGILRRGVIGETAVGNWETVMETAPYPLAGNSFDHSMNAILIDPAGRYIYVNSGSRTDHGEIQSNGGAFPDTREVPLTSAVFRIPSDTTDLILANDEEFLIDNGILFADGFRNAFDLAWGPNGHLFGSENAGARDDNDEINWIVNGGHYGFPWRMGTNETGQQFSDYDPSMDLLINPAGRAVFSNDPSYPPPHAGLVFTDPIPNSGPDADTFRDPISGELIDASDSGLTIGTLTGHRSPLGLVFDTAGTLAEPYTSDGFVLSWSGESRPLLESMDDPGEDLLHLDVTYSGKDAGYSFSATRIVGSFRTPVDAVMVGSSIFVIEMSSDGPGGLWKVELPRKVGVATEPVGQITPEAGISVFPNPVSDQLTVSVMLTASEQIRLDVIDVTGRLVVAGSSTLSGPGEHTFRVPMTGFAPGAYLARVTIGHSVLSRVVTLLR